QGNINRSVTAPLNMVPIDTIASGNAQQNERITDMNNGIAAQNGKVYALDLHTLAEQMNPLYGSGGGRWYFHSNPSDVTVPCLDVSAIYQGQMRFLTGQWQTSSNTLNNPYIADSSIAYADWHSDPGGTLYVNGGGQYPSSMSSPTDSDREMRLRNALRLP